MGLLVDEGIEFGKRGNEIAQSLEADHFLFFKSLFGMEEFYFARGENRESREIAKKLLDYGQKHNNVRSLSVSHISMRQFKEAEAPAKEVLSYSHNFGCDILKTPAQLAFGTVLISKGHFKKGIDMLADVRNSCLKNERKWLYAFSEYVLGNVYLQILDRTGPMVLSTMAKNIGFITKNVPFAGRKGREHFMEAIDVSEKIGAKSILGPAYLDLGSLYIAKKRKNQAKECISKAIQIFKQCDAGGYLKQAKETLGSLG